MVHSAHAAVTFDPSVLRAPQVMNVNVVYLCNTKVRYFYPNKQHNILPFI